jgi:hypothetical protein
MNNLGRVDRMANRFVFLLVSRNSVEEDLAFTSRGKAIGWIRKNKGMLKHDVVYFSGVAFYDFEKLELNEGLKRIGD